MGKALSTSNDYGNIFIKLEKQQYTAGDQVNGSIYVSLIHDFPSNVLYLIISGKEKVRLVTTTSKKDTHNKTEIEVNVHKDKNEFFGHTFPLYSQSGNLFPVGQYCFPFAFKLLENLPGTFIDNWLEHGEKCYAKTQYKLWAGMKETQGRLAIFSKMYFPVDQRWEHSAGSQVRNYQKNIKRYCCEDLGEFKLACRFEKDKYYVGENANFKLEIDNTKCKSDVQKINCQLIQSTRLQTNDKLGFKLKTSVLAETNLPGLNSGHSRVGKSAYQTYLHVNTQSECQASSSHNLIQNTFSLKINTKMWDCLCWETDPSTSIEIKVYNCKPTQFIPLQLPQIWSPKVMNPYVCTISNEYRMTSDFKSQVFQSQPGNNYRE